MGDECVRATPMDPTKAALMMTTGDLEGGGELHTPETSNSAFLQNTHQTERTSSCVGACVFIAQIASLVEVNYYRIMMERFYSPNHLSPRLHVSPPTWQHKMKITCPLPSASSADSQRRHPHQPPATQGALGPGLGHELSLTSRCCPPGPEIPWVPLPGLRGRPHH